MRNEIVLVDEEESKKIVEFCLANYDNSGDWWYGWSDKLDVNVYEEDDTLRIVLYPYNSPFFSLYDKWQTLASVERRDRRIDVKVRVKVEMAYDVALFVPSWMTDEQACEHLGESVKNVRGEPRDIDDDLIAPLKLRGNHPIWIVPTRINTEVYKRYLGQ